MILPFPVYGIDAARYSNVSVERDDRIWEATTLDVCRITRSNNYSRNKISAATSYDAVIIEN